MSPHLVFSEPAGGNEFTKIKILDAEVLTNYCHTCSTAKDKRKSKFCDHHFKGISWAMEVEGTEKIFGRSKTTRNVRYKYNLGDGDSNLMENISWQKSWSVWATSKSGLEEYLVRYKKKKKLNAKSWVMG